MRGHADQKRENSPKSHLAMRGFLGECWSHFGAGGERQPRERFQ